MFKYRWQTVGAISLGMTLLLWVWKLTGNYLSKFPLIPTPQKTELNLYDWLVANRGSGKIDSPIVLVALTDSDLVKYGYSPSDSVIADVILAIQKGKPKLIGLGFWRTSPTGEGWEKLQTVLANSPNIIGAQYKSESIDIIPSPALSGRTGDVAMLLDHDKLVRQKYLYPRTEEFPPEFQLSGGQYNYTRNFAWEIAYRYLSGEGVKIKEPTQKNRQIVLKFSNNQTIIINPLRGWEGENPEQRESNFSILINWPPQKSRLKFYTFEEILQGKHQKNLEGKIVLIGSLTAAIKDLYLTPNQELPNRFGLEIDAISLSNLINIQEMPPPQTLPETVKYLWILIWVGLGGIGILIVTSLSDKSGWKSQNFWGLTLLIEGGILASLVLISYWAFPRYWIPSGVAWIGALTNAGLCFVTILQQKAITEQKKRISEQEKSNQTLSEEIQQIKNRLIAQERTAFVGKFSRELAHHVNGALGTINADLEDLNYEWIALKARLEEQDLTEDYYEIINQIDEILASAKSFLLEEEGYIDKYRPIPLPENLQDLEDQEIRRILRPVEVNKLLNECLEDLLRIRRRRTPITIDIQRNLEENLPPIEAVSAELWFVFSNLIDNAYDALLAKLEQAQEIDYQPRLQIRTWREDEEICLEIADNGIGVPPALEQKIFSFFISTKGQGKGLGLSFARDYVVGYYNGSLTLISADGLTKFLIRFPVSR